MSKLALNDVNIFYGDFHAVQNVNMQIPAQAVTAFIGPSGCGKSTLLRCIAGLETPDAGTIAIGERGLWSADQCGRQQAPAVYGLPRPRTVAAHDGGKEHRVSADNPRQ